MIKKKFLQYSSMQQKPWHSVSEPATVPFNLQGVPLKHLHTKEAHPILLRLYGLLCQMTVHWPNLGLSVAHIHFQGGVFFISALWKIQKRLLDCKDEVRRKGILWPSIYFILGHPWCLKGSGQRSWREELSLRCMFSGNLLYLSEPWFTMCVSMILPAGRGL